jgi:xanthine dehydrogenase accessory factor
MKEIKTIIDAYRSTDHDTERLALATVVRVEGSSYRRTGARMLVSNTGRYFGGISGGCLEGDALRRAQKAIVFNNPSIITYDTTQEDGHEIGVGLGCNGIIDVLFTPLNPEDPKNVINILSSVVQTRVLRVLLTITASTNEALLGKAVLFDEEQNFIREFPVPNLAEQVLLEINTAVAEETSRNITLEMGHEQVRVFIEVILPVQRIAIFGSNYDIYPLMRISRELGWEVSVITNINKADKQLFVLADFVIHHANLQQLNADRFMACLLMAHDLETDFRNFRFVVKTPASYIGLLGPRKRAEKIFQRIATENEPVSEIDMQRIYAPAGLDIGAVTPEEIALSIVAEVRTHFSGRKGMSLRERQGTIYGNG